MSAKQCCEDGAGGSEIILRIGAVAEMICLIIPGTTVNSYWRLPESTTLPILAHTYLLRLKTGVYTYCILLLLHIPHKVVIQSSLVL